MTLAPRISFCPRVIGPVFLVFVVGAFGCERPGRDSVVEYTVPKEPAPAPVASPSRPAAPPLSTADAQAGVLPDGHPPLDTAPSSNAGLPAGHPPLDGGVVPAPALPVDAPVIEGEVMTWTLPEGWTDEATRGSMRFATLRTPGGADAVEFAVSRLTGGGGGLVANVNLWRQQVGLPPLAGEEIPALVQPIGPPAQTRGGLFDITGVAAEGATTVPRILVAVFPTETHTWFVKGAGDAAALEPHRAAFVDVCHSIAFTETAPAAATSRPAAPTSQPAAPPSSNAVPPDGMAWGAIPAGWSMDATPKTMSVASFSVVVDGQQGSFTITPLGGTQDLLGNVNRWRGQVGLAGVADAAAAGTVPFEISGAPGHLVEVIGPQNGILGAMSTRGTTTWFYKLSGPAALVASQRPAFEAFLRTVRHDG